MNKLLVSILLLLIILSPAVFLAGCLPEEEEEDFDEAALVAVDNYIKEMTAALSDSTLRADLQGWSREYYEDDEPPFYYDQERREWLAEHREELTALRQKHRKGSDFPSSEEVAGWEVIIVRGEQEWLLYGGEVIEALDLLEVLFAEVLAVIDLIISNEGELDEPQSKRVLDLLDEIDPAVEEVRSIFFP